MKRGFSLLEVVIASALVLVVSYSAFTTTEVINRREKEEQLRHSLLEIRTALEEFRHDNLRYPDSFNELITAPRPLGAFYLRRMPINPVLGEVKWQIASRTTGVDDFWLDVTLPETTIDHGYIVDVRCPPDAGTGLNEIPYHLW